MSLPDSLHGRPSPLEAGLTPIWVDITRQLRKLPEGSIGHTLISDSETYELLSGRKRPVTILNQPLVTMWGRQTDSRAKQALADVGVRTVKQFLRLTPEFVATIPDVSVVQEEVGRYVASLAISPHARLIHALRSDYSTREEDDAASSGSIPARDEVQVEAAVDRAIRNINVKGVTGVFETDRYKQAVIRRFGIVDGIRRTYREIAQQLEQDATAGPAYENYVALGLGKIKEYRWRDKGKRLTVEGFTPTPNACFGRTVFGALFKNDLPAVSGTVTSLGLSFDTLREIARATERHPNKMQISRLVAMDLSRFQLSETAQADVVAALRKERMKHQIDTDVQVVFDATSDTPVPKVLPMFESQEQAMEYQKQLGNNLLPEISLTPAQFAAICNIPFEDLELPNRYYNSIKRGGIIQTAGDLFKCTRDDLYKLGYKGFEELGRSIERLLNVAPQAGQESQIMHLMRSTVDSRSRPAHVNMREGFHLDSKLRDRRRDIVEQARKDREGKQLGVLRTLISQARENGKTSVADIQSWIAQHGEIPFPSVHPNSLVVTALIEYAIHHEEKS